MDTLAALALGMSNLTGLFVSNKCSYGSPVSWHPESTTRTKVRAFDQLHDVEDDHRPEHLPAGCHFCFELCREEDFQL